jgi:hypothetical protein
VLWTKTVQRKENLNAFNADTVRHTCCTCLFKSQQERQCTHNVILWRVHEILLPLKSCKSYIFLCACVCARVCVGARPCACARVVLHIQHATRIAILSAASLAPPNFSILSQTARFSKNLWNIKCVFRFSLLLIIKITQRDIVINVKTSSCKIPVILVGL